jgi:hypothetical protein
MVRIFVVEEAFEAIKATLPVGSVAFKLDVARGERQLWLERVWAAVLGTMRGPGKTFSHLIMRLAVGERRSGEGS